MDLEVWKIMDLEVWKFIDLEVWKLCTYKYGNSRLGGMEIMDLGGMDLWTWEVWNLWTWGYGNTFFSTLCMREVKALTRLCICTGSSEHSLVDQTLKYKHIAFS